MGKVNYRKIIIFVLLLLAIGIVVAEARRGFSSTGSGGGAYDDASPIGSWDFDATLDADCQAIYGENCNNLTAAQFENVQAQYDAAQSAGYGSHTDYVMAAERGYRLTQNDATLWAAARSQTSGAFANDCRASSQVLSGVLSGLENLLGGCADIAYSDYAQIGGGAGRDYVIALGYGRYADYLAAAADDKGYTKTTEDAIIWSSANDGSVAQADCQAAVAAATSAPDINLDESTATCAQLSKISFLILQEDLATAALEAKIVAAKDSIIDGTLSADDLADLEIDFTSSALVDSSADSILNWQLDYLETILPTASTTTIEDWQSEIDNYDTKTASRWLIGALAGGTQSDLSLAGISLFVDAGVSLDYLTRLGISDIDIRGDIVSSGLLASSTTSVLKDWLSILAGFSTAQSFIDWQAAGHDVISFPIVEWERCYASIATQINQCTVSSTQWALIGANEADITSAVLINFYTTIEIDNDAFTNAKLRTLTQEEADYLRECILGLPVRDMARIKVCAVKATSDDLNLFIVKQIYEKKYDNSKLTVQLLEDLGVFKNDANAREIFAGDYCKKDGVVSENCMVHARHIIDNLTAAGARDIYENKDNLRTVMCQQMTDVYWRKVKSLSWDKHYVVESCQRAVFEGEFKRIKQALDTPNSTIYQTDMAELDGEHSISTGAYKFSFAYNRFSGDDLVFHVPGNVARRRQNSARLIARLEGGSCIAQKNATWNYEYVVSIMENQPDAEANSYRDSFLSNETDFNNRAYTCSVCQASSAPDWCYDYGSSIVTTAINGWCTCANGRFRENKGCSADATAQSLPADYRYQNVENQPTALQSLSFANVCP